MRKGDKEERGSSKEIGGRLQREAKEKLNLTDADANFMQELNGVIKPAANLQVAVTP